MTYRIPLLIAVLFFMLFGRGNAQYTPGQTYFGTNNYIEYHAGNLPIIISAPHGGYLTPGSIPDRTCGGCVTVRDSRTEELSYELDSAVQVLFGGYPHVIINKLARIKLDANREIVEAAQGNADAETAWFEFHDFIQAAKDSVVRQFGGALYIDLHGHGHTIQRLELGYLLRRSDLQQSDAVLNAQNFQDSSSIRHLSNVLNPGTPFADLLRGSDCMGEFMVSRGFPSVPSASDPAPAGSDPYFSGGYNTRRHGSKDSSRINGIQFELNFTGVRDNAANRAAFARALACAMRSYLDTWFFDLDAWDPGNVVTNTADRGPGSLREALLGAEEGDVITFSAALNGDTIRLGSELRICSGVTLQGPGADQLAISGEDSTRILRVMPGDSATVRGLSLVFGHSPIGEDGGAVLAEGSLRMVDCILAENFSEDDGGALSLDASATVVLDSCVIRNNSCLDDGGALRCLTGVMQITNSTVADNVSPSQGGGLSASGTVQISASTFSGNQAVSSGGAIRCFGGSVTCVNSTFYGNQAGNRGAGISTTSRLEMDFCTLVANTASSLGGGIRMIGDTALLQNTLVAQNTGSGEVDVSLSSGAFVSEGHNFIGDSTGSDWVTVAGDQTGNTGAPLDPLVLMLAQNSGPTETVALQSGSPCIDQGDSVAAPATDQRGWMRVFGAQADIGAFEFQPPLHLGGGSERLFGDEPGGDEILLYPNPVKEVLQLKFPEAGKYRIAIYNLEGKRMESYRVQKAMHYSIEVSTFPRGMYLVKVRGERRFEGVIQVWR